MIFLDMFRRFVGNIKSNVVYAWKYYFEKGCYPFDPGRIPFIICFLGFVVMLVARYPGEWDSDTESQYMQMLNNSYNDWHPPIMSAFWGFVNKAWFVITGVQYTGSGILFLVHSIMAFGGLAWLLSMTVPFWRSRPPAQLLLCVSFLVLVVLWEFVPMMRFVWKDTGMAAAWFMAAALLVNWPKSNIGKLVGVALCVGGLWYGAALRHNSILALYPLLVLLIWRLHPRFMLWKNFIISFFVWAVFIWSFSFVNYSVLKSERLFPYQERFFADIYAINYKSKSYSPPPNIYGQNFSALDEKVFRDFYARDPYIKNSFRYINKILDEPLRLSWNKEVEPGENLKLFRAWGVQVLRNFGKYIDIRRRIYFEFLQSYNFLFLNSNTLVVLTFIIVLLSYKDAFRSVDERKMLSLGLGLSSLFYVFPYFVFLTDDMRRYLNWTFLSSVLCLALYMSSSLFWKSIGIMMSEVVERFIAKRVLHN